MPAGIALTLIGVIGDLLGHTLNPRGHTQEALIILGRGNNPWHTGAATSAGQHADHPAATTVGEGAEGAEGAEGTSSFGSHTHSPGPTTEEEWLVLGRQLAAAKAATARFQSIARARAAGYFQVTQFIPGLGLHLANLHIRQDVFDPTHPQLLLYMPKRSGGYVLAGVGYMFVHQGVPPEGFVGGQDVWHFHTNLCFLPDGSVTLAPGRAACRTRSGVFQKQTAWLLHAWIWRANPNGVFTEANPMVF